MLARWAMILIAAILGAVPAALARAADIEVKVIHFGTGDVARGAGTLAVQCDFRSGLDRVIELEAVLELPNADLDIAEHSRSFVLNPGQSQRRWIYGTLPPMGEGTLRSSIFELRLYELEGGQRARDLGTAQIAPELAENTPRVLSPEEDAVLVVGARSAGLDIYAQLPNGLQSIPALNTVTAVANLRDTESFPDRWEGYSPFATVVWSSGAVVPSRLSEEAVRALAEWTERGGNLVIALPSAGDPWDVGVAGRHGLSELLPSVAPTRIEDVPVTELLPILSLERAIRARDARMRVAVFDEATLDRGWRPFVAMPSRKSANGVPEPRADSLDARIVAVRREFGFGHITLLGLDVDELAARALQTPAIPQGDVFWNRILGRRGDTLSGAEYAALSDANRLTTRGGYTRAIGEGAEVAGSVGLTGQAAVGALAALGVFALYWVVAGPLGFAVLRRMGRQRWSWVVYVAVALVFTAAIWMVGSGLASNAARVRHFTVLDVVERAPGESDVTKPQPKRATGWLSLFVPDYGTVEVALDRASDAALVGTPRNTLASWRASGSDAEGFPSRERYRVPLDSPDALGLPARSTSIDLETRWMGALAPEWGRMPHATAPVSVTVDRSAAPATISIAGQLTHGLPAVLNDVTIVHVWPVRNDPMALGTDKPPTRRAPGQLPNRGVMRSVASWAPGEPLDLAKQLPRAAITDRGVLERELRQTYYDPIYRAASQFGGFGGVAESPMSLVRSMPMLSLYGMLQPPDYLQNPPQDPEVLRITRHDMRELDLSCWLAQPCLIVMGTLVEVPLPYGLTVDGEAVPSSGPVFVRWIMPLPDSSDWIVPLSQPPRGGRAGSAATTARDASAAEASE